MGSNMKKALIRGLSVTAIGLGLVACDKPQSPAGNASGKPEAVSPAAPHDSADLVARIHWRGKQSLAADTNAAAFLTIWDMPESVRLVNQTLDKLALAPWRMREGWTTNTPATNYSATLIRPLLDDLVNAECFLEVSQGTNQLSQCVLALRVGEQRSAVWQENLQKALEDLTGIKAVANKDQGWVLTKHDYPDRIEFERTGAWTLLACSQGASPLLARWTAAIAAGTERSGLSSSNYWVEAELDLDKIAQPLGSLFGGLGQLPKLTIAATGDGESVRTSGKFKFPKALELNLDPWQMPTNLLSDPLVSFAAVRGIRPFLSLLESWHGLRATNTPNQFFSWSLAGAPFLSYAAVPLDNSSAALEAISEPLTNRVGPVLSSQGLGRIVRQSPTNIVWTGFPFLAPSIVSLETGGGQFLKSSLWLTPPTNRPPPSELYSVVFSRTNLVLYEWEITAPRIEAWIYLGQLVRIFSGRSQLPLEGAGNAWLKSVGGKLGNCVMAVTAEDKDTLSFTRRSSLGLSSFELHILMDWLESPAFPKGFHSLLVPKPPIANLRPTSSTNSVIGFPVRPLPSK